MLILFILLNNIEWPMNVREIIWGIANNCSNDCLNFQDLITGTEGILYRKLHFLCNESLLSIFVLAPVESLQLTKTLTDITKVAIQLLHQVNQEYWRLIKRTSTSLLKDDVVASELFFYSVRGNK